MEAQTCLKASDTEAEKKTKAKVWRAVKKVGLDELVQVIVRKAHMDPSTTRDAVLDVGFKWRQKREEEEKKSP
jgi:hypothetical protein